MSKSILITGGAGLVGSHLCESLLKQDYFVMCVDNFITGKQRNVQHLLDNPSFRLIEADVSKSVDTYLDPQTPVGYIFHLASPASPKGYQEHPIETYLVNSQGTHNIMMYAREVGASVVYSSTSEAYGDPLEHPQKETYWGNVNPIGPRACYDESKRFGEMVCSTFAREFGVDVRIARFFNTYGPRNDPNDGRVVPNIINQALKNEPITIYGDGSQTRSFCYISDLIVGLEKLMFTPNLKGEVFNLGNPDEFKILDFAQLIKKMTNSQSEMIFKNLPIDDPKQRRPDITKAKTILNWQPTVLIEQGLVPTIEYYRGLLNLEK